MGSRRWATVAGVGMAVLSACGTPADVQPVGGQASLDELSVDPTPDTSSVDTSLAAELDSTAPETEAAPEVALPAGEDTTVERVVDGDTLVVAGGTRVRLIGIDTPETKDPRRGVQCFGPEASDEATALVGPGTAVRLVYDVDPLDRYGRVLAYVYRRDDGLFVNAALVAEGFAQPATYPPNVAHAEEFASLAGNAREQGLGLWSACSAEPAGAAMPVPIMPPAPVMGPSPSPGGSCDAAYPGVCIPSAPPDLDCGQISPRRFQVLPPDPHGFDGDHDGVGCESG